MQLDLLVLGSGVAGLSAAVRATALEPGLRVGVLTKAELSQSVTRWAQGGVAAVLGGDEDSTDLHLADTLAAGAGLCDVPAVRVLVDEGPLRVNELMALGAVFDRDHEGGLLKAREGGHSVPRVVHAGGAATGAEIERALVEAVRATAAVVLEGWFALDLIVEEGRCRGVVALDLEGVAHEVRASHVLIATGGAGQLFAVTTNPAEATGDGVAMALRAGVAVADIEFVQFHPTALHHPAMPRPLLSEALRGHGALIRDAAGHRFVDEMQPRDVVSMAMTARMVEQGVDHLWLDATGLERFGERFPTIAAMLARVELDPAAEWLPIAPAAHYQVGGILTDLDGACALPGLWACGEVACTGVHGANRLASNSLLEGMVFAARVVEAIAAGKSSCDPSGAMSVLSAPAGRRVLSLRGPLPTGSLPPDGGALPAGRLPGDAVVDYLRSVSLDGGLSGRRQRDDASSGPEVVDFDGAYGPPPGPLDGAYGPTPGPLDPVKAREVLQRAMTSGAGVSRSSASLDSTASVLESLTGVVDPEVRNLVVVGLAVALAATAREESRGAHNRTDFPQVDDERFCRRLVIA